MADTALQVVGGTSLQANQPQTFAPRTLDEAIRFAELISDSGMVPKDYINKPGAIIVALQMGMEVGLQPLQALQSIAVINGRPAIWGDGALAIVKTHPEFVSIHEDNIETIKKNNKATCIIKRRGQPDVTVTFGQDDAVTAGLWKKQGPWTQYPYRMMQVRARGFAIRDQFPDALKGIKTVEELQDYPGETIEGQPASQATTQPDTEQKKTEEVIGQAGGSAFYKAYRASGWTAPEAKQWLADTLQIGEPHNKKDSRDIPVSEWKDGTSKRAFNWATTPAPIRLEAENLFDQLGFSKEEAVKFHGDHKGNWAAITTELKAEIERRNEAEMGE